MVGGIEMAVEKGRQLSGEGGGSQAEEEPEGAPEDTAVVESEAEPEPTATSA
jgi:hypothetical protein